MVGQVAWFLLILAVGAKGNSGELTDEQLAARQAVGEANNAFGVDLYQAVKSQPGNLILSPLSAGAVLALVLQGAGGATAQQLIQTLRLPEDQATVRQGFAAVFHTLQKFDANVFISMANNVYLAKGSQIKEDFRNIAEQDFDAETDELDFANENQQSVDAINEWVEENTDNKIQDLFSKLDPTTLMVLVNAIYFEGTWLYTFKKSATQKQPFFTSSTTQVLVPMMHTTAKLAYGRIPDLNARIIELPYADKETKMLIILPDEIDGLPKVEAGLNTINFTQLSGKMTTGKVILSLPKFKIESTYELENTLSGMGIIDLFNTNANLTGITDTPVNVNTVVQKAYIGVDEDGSVAAAATGVVRLKLALPTQVTFQANHPFLFFIMDSSYINLFMGRILEP